MIASFSITAMLTAAPFESSLGQVPDTRCWAEFRALDTLPQHAPPATRAALRTALINCADLADNHLKQALLALQPEAISLTSAFFSIPEYHDEGRLPGGTDANGVYLGPIAAIFASPYLDGFKRASQIYEQVQHRMLAALVVVELKVGEVIPPAYQNLHLANGVNCIWLAVNSPNPPVSYQAFVTHGAPCLRTNPMLGPLSVVPRRDLQFAANANYPPVARFDTDVTGTQPVLAFKCLDAFCEVGVSPAMVRPRWISATGMVGPDRRVRVIKGWHDEQVLAMRDANSVWRPSGVRATITPQPSAAGYSETDFSGSGRFVAILTIHGNLPAGSKYYAWGLRSGDNEVWLRSTTGGTVWETMIRPRATPGASTVWRNTVRMIHDDAAVPATARFRWTTIDDGIWVPCGNACCRSDGVN